MTRDTTGPNTPMASHYAQNQAGPTATARFPASSQASTSFATGQFPHAQPISSHCNSSCFHCTSSLPSSNLSSTSTGERREGGSVLLAASSSRSSVGHYPTGILEAGIQGSSHTNVASYAQGEPYSGPEKFFLLV